MNAIDERGQVAKVLRGHTDAESAVVIADYPYGQQRCQIRYWVETATKGAKKGQQRLVHQTEHPRTKRWNNPKLGGYVLFEMFLVEFENGHIDGIPAPSSGYPDRWARFWNSGIWKHLDESERKRVAYVLKLFIARSPKTWQDSWFDTIAEIQRLGVPTLEEWKAQREGYVNDAAYGALRAYVEAGGPDLRAPQWWAL
ncbi:hypothetical protein ACTD5D_40270 [Nocardia takedensis]|uniref:hypothetical protein n=1 Tax=Nocardia takedensis TaxID=259390 RepID=UPI003F757EA8